MAQAGVSIPRSRPSIGVLWLPVVAALTIFSGHLLYGAALRQASLYFILIYAVLLTTCLVVANTRSDALRLKGLGAPTLLFSITIGVALWSMTPFIPGGPHPIWAYSGISPGAATLDRSATLMEIIRLLGLACIFLVGAVAGASDQRARGAVNAILVAGVAYALYVFFHHLSVAPGQRLGGSLQAANATGTLFAGLFLMALGQGVSQLRAAGARDRLNPAVALPLSAALVFSVCLLMTASRGAFLGTGVALVVFAALEFFGGKIKLSRAALIGLGSILALGGLLYVAGDMMLDRFLESGATDEARRQMAEIHWRAFQDAPLMGYGLGSFDTVNRTLLDSQNFSNLWVIRAVHNVYITWLEQAGILGATPMFLLIGLLIFVTARNALQRTRLTHTLFALLAVDVLYLVHGFTDFTLEIYSMAAMWAYMLGLQFSLSFGSRSR